MARASSVLVKTEEPAEAYKKSNKNNKKYTRRAVKKASRIKPRKVKSASKLVKFGSKVKIVCPRHIPLAKESLYSFSVMEVLGVAVYVVVCAMLHQFK